MACNETVAVLQPGRDPNVTVGFVLYFRTEHGIVVSGTVRTLKQLEQTECVSEATTHFDLLRPIEYLQYSYDYVDWVAPISKTYMDDLTRIVCLGKCEMLTLFRISRISKDFSI